MSRRVKSKAKYRQQRRQNERQVRKLVDRMYEESINQEDWAEQGESTVVGSGPELLFKGAECIVAQHDLIERQRQYIKSLERRKDVYDE